MARCAAVGVARVAARPLRYLPDARRVSTRSLAGGILCVADACEAAFEIVGHLPRLVCVRRIVLANQIERSVGIASGTSIERVAFAERRRLPRTIGCDRLGPTFGEQQRAEGAAYLVLVPALESAQI